MTHCKTWREIKDAVKSGKAVYWKSLAYRVSITGLGDLWLTCNSMMMGVYEPDFSPSDFFIS